MRFVKVTLTSALLLGCQTTDYTKNLNLVENCVGVPSKQELVNIKIEDSASFDIGSKGSKCIYIGDRPKSFYKAFKVESGTNFLLVNANQNVSISGSSYFEPELYAINADHRIEKVNYKLKMKTSKLIPVRYYSYHYDLRNIDTRNFLISTDSTQVGNNILFEYVNSYDLVTQASAEMPLAPGGIVEVKALSEVSENNII